MGIFKRKQKREAAEPTSAAQAWIVSADAYDTLCVQGYTDLAHCPEVVTAARTIADLVASMTIHIMANTESGDKRIINELSRTIDINPMPNMTRFTWVEAIMMNLLLYGKGNSIVQPHTHDGFLESLEPIAADRVDFKPIGRRDYRVLIDGREKRPEGLLHFVLNPDRYYPWKGSGLTVSLKDVADTLKQARATEKGFMESKWKPSLIVKVDGLTDEFASPEGREKLLDSYVKSGSAGEPWIIPADQFQVEQVKPLTLADLAISDMHMIMSGEAMTIRIGFAGQIHNLFRCMKEFRKDRPDVQFDLNSDIESIDHIDINDFDVLIYPDEPRYARFSGYRIGKETYSLAVCAESEAARHVVATQELMQGRDYVFLKHGDNHIEFPYRVCTSLAMNMRSQSFADSRGAHRRLISTGMAVGFVPEGEAAAYEREKNIRLLPILDQRFSRRMMICFKREKHLSETALAFKKKMMDYFGLLSTSREP